MAEELVFHFDREFDISMSDLPSRIFPFFHAFADGKTCMLSTSLASQWLYLDLKFKYGEDNPPGQKCETLPGNAGNKAGSIGN